jgi:hypothetical protein
VLRNDGSFLEKDLGEHHAIAGEESASDVAGYSFALDVIPLFVADE